MADFVDTLKKGAEKTIDVAETVTKAAIKKTTESVNAMKLNFSIKEANDNINKLYRELGEMLFEEFDQGSEFGGEYKEKCEKIVSLKDSIAELKVQLAELKNQKICPSCGAHSDKDSQFCSSCGNNMED